MNEQKDSPASEGIPERIKVVIRAATSNDWIGVAYCKDYAGDPSTIHEFVRVHSDSPSVDEATVTELDELDATLARMGSQWPYKDGSVITYQNTQQAVWLHNKLAALSKKLRLYITKKGTQNEVVDMAASAPVYPVGCNDDLRNSNTGVDEAAELETLRNAVRDYFSIDPTENVAGWCVANDNLLRLVKLPETKSSDPVARLKELIRIANTRSCPDCTHSDVASDGLCAALIPLIDKEPHGSKRCNCPCVNFVIEVAEIISTELKVSDSGKVEK